MSEAISGKLYKHYKGDVCCVQSTEVKYIDSGELLISYYIVNTRYDDFKKFSVISKKMFQETLPSGEKRFVRV